MSSPILNIRDFPVELAQSFNDISFLHVLATEPSKVLPPGKSLVSMLTRHNSFIQPSEDRSPEAALRNRVEGLLHGAFWDEAVDALSSPDPTIQIDRLKRLNLDLLDVLKPLLPVQHPILISLSTFPPTSSPLSSMVIELKEILTELKKRCAPIRDAAVTQIFERLDNNPPVSSESNSNDSPGANPSRSPLALLIVAAIKDIISLSDNLKSDLNDFVLGTMSEDQIQRLVVEQAQSRERQLTLELWSSDEISGKYAMLAVWKTWMETLDSSLLPTPTISTEIKWMARVVQAITTNIPVSCTPPILRRSSGDDNDLPPHFLFSAHKLLYLQNYLQALVIAASLRALTRLPSTVGPSSPLETFMQRIWSLLVLELDEGQDDRNREDQTKVANLADEVVQARRIAISRERPAVSAAFTSDEEMKLRSAVERTLQPTDPVFLLLQKRLASHLIKHLSPARESKSPESSIPLQMQTGRDNMAERASQKPRLIAELESKDSNDWFGRAHDTVLPPLKGFEEPILLHAITSVVLQLETVFDWVHDCWPESLHLTGELRIS